MMATLLSFLGYLLYPVLMVALLILVSATLFAAFPSLKKIQGKLQRATSMSILHIIAITLKNIMWAVLISESRYTLPSSVSQVIAILVSCLVSMMIGAVVLYICCPRAALEQPQSENIPLWMEFTVWVVILVVMDIFLSYFDMMATLPSLAGNSVCMAALSCLLLGCAAAAFVKSRVWWYVLFPPELILPIVVGLTLLLLNTMWGTPLGKLADASGMRGALASVAGYLIYILSSVTIWYCLHPEIDVSDLSKFGSMCNKSRTSFHRPPSGTYLLLRTFTISLTLALLHMMVKPSDVVAALATLTIALLALLFLVALSFGLLVVLQTWVEILLPSAMENCPQLVLATIIGLTFKLVETMLEPSIFSGMKARLLGIAYMISYYHVVYLVLRYLTVIVVLLFITQSRCTASVCLAERVKNYTAVAFLVALGVLLRTPPTADLASHDLVHRAITSIVTNTLLILVTVIGFMVYYVRYQWPIWMNNLAERSKEWTEQLSNTIAEKLKTLYSQHTKGLEDKTEGLGEKAGRAFTCGLRRFVSGFFYGLVPRRFRKS